MSVQYYLRQRFPGYKDDTYFTVDSNDIDVPILPFVNIVESSAFEHFLTTENGKKQKNPETNAKTILPKLINLQKGEGLRFPPPKTEKGRKNPYLNHIFGKNYAFPTVEEFMEINWDLILMEINDWLLERSGWDNSHGWAFKHPLKKLALFKRYLTTRRNANKNAANTTN